MAEVFDQRVAELATWVPLHLTNEEEAQEWLDLFLPVWVRPPPS